MNLFILGNGFDLAHTLPTRYMDFRTYLEDTDWEYLSNLEAPYGYVPESRLEWVEIFLWRDFESNLSSINEGEIIDAGNIDMGLEGGDIGIEDTLDVYWEEQYGYIQKLNDYIKEWVEQIDINIPQITNKIKELSNDLFLSFNYTLLLEKIYKIDPFQILHIHGSIDTDKDIPPVIGHGNISKISNSNSKAYGASENFWEKDASIYKALVNYYERTLKDVRHYMGINRYFFEQLKSIDEVFVVGHSFGDVDMPYFKKVLDSVSEKTIWNIYYYNETERDEFEEKILSIGVEIENIKLLPSTIFYEL